MGRKLRESEKQLAIIGYIRFCANPIKLIRVARSENERLVEELQDKLDEARSEVTQRRKDEKEMKGQERALLIQIACVSDPKAFSWKRLTARQFETDIQILQKSVENSKANHANMQKMYNSQCGQWHSVIVRHG